MYEAGQLKDSYKVFRSLFRLFEIDAKVAQQTGDVQRALESNLAYLKLASVIGHGGKMDDQMRATALWSAGVDRIRSIQGSLNTNQREQAIKVLDDVLASIEPAEDIVVRETGKSVFPPGSTEEELFLRQKKYVSDSQAVLTGCRSDLVKLAG